MKFLVSLHLAWIGIVTGLGFWWSRVILSQAAQLAQARGQLGQSLDVAEQEIQRIKHMIFWESATFYVLLLALSLLMLWFYSRDHRRMKSLQAFFASVTHELRTPLTSIRLQAESLPSGVLTSRILEDTVRLEGQVERTLELARLEGGGRLLNESFPLRPQVAQIERWLRHWSEHHQGRASVEVHLGDHWIQGDATAIQVVLRNLLENAMKHSGASLPVKIEIESRSSDPGYCEVVVRDDGAGFQGNVAHLGQLFWKGPRSTGTGVGLYLVQSLMKRMGGGAHFASGAKGFEVKLRFKEATPL